MRNAKDIIESTSLEMRWRALSLAADLDRIERAPGGAAILRDDPFIARFRQAIALLQTDGGNRAERFQMIFSDTTPRP